MTYKIINQFGKIIDGEERAEILKAYLLGFDKVEMDQGIVNIVKIAIDDNEVVISTEITFFDKE